MYTQNPHALTKSLFALQSLFTHPVESPRHHFRGIQAKAGVQPLPTPPVTYKHCGPILECAGDSWHTGIIGQPSVAVPGWQGGVEEGLLSRVVSLRLVLLSLGESGGRGRRGSISPTKFCYITWEEKKKSPLRDRVAV